MVPLHHPWMRPDRSIMHRHTQKHIPTLIDNIAVPPSVCLVGLSHHLREATPSPIQHSTPLPPSLSPLSLPTARRRSPAAETLHLCTTPSCCRSNLSLHPTCWTEEGGDVEVPYVCISRRHRHLRCWIGSDREEEKRVRLHQPRSVERSVVRIFKGMKI